MKIIRTLLLSALACLLALSGHSATFTVSNTNDSGSGSLRQAIIDSLSTVGTHEIQAGGVTGTISLQTALPVITNRTIAIHGPTSGTLTVTRGVAAPFRIFTVNNSGGPASLTVNRLAITNGDGGSIGGNIYVVSSALTLNFCTVSGGLSSSYGGGIAIEGTGNATVNIHACTISGNTGGIGQGGGLYCSDGNGVASHTLNITDSTISGNHSTGSSGGGLFVSRTLANVRNCTFSGNRANFNGGAIAVGSSSVTLNLINCTITNNVCDAGSTGGGGIRGSGTGGSTTNLINTIVAGNLLGTTPNDTSWGSGTRTAKNSVVGVNADTAFSPVTASQIGIPGSPKVVNLGPLANNGGPTQTHALLPSSPELAINLGSNQDAISLATDQRGVGFNRLAGGTVDMGAFESGVTAPVFTGVTPLGAPATVVNSNTLSFTVPPGTNRMLLVVASHADSGAVNFTGVTFGASAMTSAGFKSDASVAVDSFWTLPLGTSTTATSGTITVTPPGGQEAAHGIIAMAFQNVNQTTPTSGFASTNNTGTGSNPSINVTSAAGDLVVDVLDVWTSNVATPLVRTPGAGQGAVAQINAPITNPPSTYTGFGCYSVSLKPGSTSTTMSWTNSYEAMILAGLNIKQAVSVTAPLVSSPTAASILATTATLGGNVTSDGGSAITERGVVYSRTSLDADPNIGEPNVTKVTASGTTGVFTAPITGLTASTGYSFKAYAINSIGTTYTSVSTFVTTAPPNNAPTDITLSNASIAENNAANATIGTLMATDADAGQSHTFTLVGGTGSADNGAFTITGNTLTINAAADFETKNSYAIRIRATDNGAGNLTFEKPFTISITNVTIPQSISFGALGGKTFGDAAFTVSATGGASGQPVTFSIFSGPATISGNTVTLTGAGSVTVRASQAGAGDFSAATPVDQSFTVAQAAQTISFGALGGKTFGDAPFAVSATGGASGQPVTFSIFSGPATISGNTVTLTGAGNVTVRASQAGNANYLAATPVDRSFTVARAAQTITFGALGGKTFGDAAFTVSATGGASGQPVVFSIFSGPATISGNTVTITGAGNVTVRASQAGDANYLAATPVDRSFTVAQATQTITFNPPGTATVTDSIALSATGGASGNAVTFSLVNGPGSLSGNTLTFTGTGNVEVRASQAGNANYFAAADVDRTIIVSPPGNSAPTNITLSNATIAENNTPGATIGTLTATDPDIGQTHTFALAAGGADNGAFTITGNTLTINAAADFETKSSYSIRIRATDNGAGNLTFEKDFTVTITDVTAPQTIAFNVAPTALTTDTVTLSGTGGASGNPVTFSVFSGPGSISGNTLTFTSAGTVVVRAEQAAGGDYSAATPVDRSIVVSAPVTTPTVVAVAPATGSVDGGTSVTITGTNFTGVTGVTIGGNVAVISAATATSLTVTTAPHAEGVVDVVVTTIGGTATGTGLYTYQVTTPAVDDAATTGSGPSVVFPLANDPVADTTVTSVSEPTVEISAGGRALMVPAAFVGSFTYTTAAATSATVVVAAGTPQAAAVSYNGLLRDSTGDVAGMATVTFAAKGSLSTRLQVGDANGSGKFTFDVGATTGGGATTLGAVTLTRNVDGTVDYSIAATGGALTGKLRPLRTATVARRYHVALASLDAGIPGGGYSTVVVTTNGLAKLTGTLPDGRPFTASSALSDNGTIAFFAEVSSGAIPSGYIGGEVVAANLAKTDVTGEVMWTKPLQGPGAKGPHLGGVDTTLTANGSHYGGSITLAGAGTLKLSGGNLAADESNAVTITGGKAPAPTGSLVRWPAVKAVGGTFGVKVRIPGVTLPVAGKGIYLPKSNTAWGYFPGTTLGGRIELTVP